MPPPGNYVANHWDGTLRRRHHHDRGDEQPDVALREPAGGEPAVLTKPDAAPGELGI